MLLSEAQIKEKQRAELERLIGYVGGNKHLAAQLGVQNQTVCGWVRRGRISATYATVVERLSCGKFKRKDLRPDVDVWNEAV